MFSCGEEGGHPPGLHEAAPFQHIKGGDPSPLVGLGKICWEWCVQFWLPQHKLCTDILEGVRQRTKKLIYSLEHVSCEERLRERGHKYLMGVSEEGETSLYSGAQWGKTTTDKHKTRNPNQPTTTKTDTQQEAMGRNWNTRNSMQI